MSKDRENDTRQRQRGDPILCPKCGADAFVYSTQRVYPANYPHVIAVRVRYYRCGSPTCAHRFKV